MKRTPTRGKSDSRKCLVQGGGTARGEKRHPKGASECLKIRPNRTGELNNTLKKEGGRGPGGGEKA